MGIDTMAARAVASAFRRLGVAAVYHAADDGRGAGEPVPGKPVLVIPVQADGDLAGVLQDVSMSANLFEMQVSQVPDIKVGARLVFGGATYKVQAKPTHPDGNRLVWRLDCAEAEPLEGGERHTGART